MPEQVETEIKLRISGPDEARARVQGLDGARRVRERHFEDNLLLDDARGSLDASGRALRLRRVDGTGVFTFKGPRQGGAMKRRTEIEVAIAEPDALEAILGGLGYRKVFRYQKYRETYTWNDVEIVVDETPVGTFLEIEGAEAGIRDAARALGFQPADYLTESYSSLYFASGGTGDMVFP